MAEDAQQVKAAEPGQACQFIKRYVGIKMVGHIVDDRTHTFVFGARLIGKGRRIGMAKGEAGGTV